MLREFTFINQTGDPASGIAKQDDLPTVRSHVMREIRRQKRLASKIHGSRSVEAHPSTSATDHRSEPSSTSLTRGRTNSFDRTFSRLYDGTAIGLDNLPNDVPRHLHYFIHGFTHLTFPTTYVHYSCHILDIALNEGDPALLHALCAIGACHLALTQGSLIRLSAKHHSETGRAFLRHKQYAIVALRKRLLQYVRSKDHSLLSVIVLLLVAESLSGDLTTANAHRVGLLELVRCFKGPQDPSPLLVSDILMSDIKSASSSLSKPLMQLDHQWLCELNDLKHLPFLTGGEGLVSLGSGFMETEVKQLLGPKLSSLMFSMRGLISAIEHNSGAGIDASGVHGAHVLALEHQILSIPDGNDKNRLRECCRIAALLYCNLCIWSWPKNATLVMSLLARLRAALPRLVSESLTHQQYPFLYWLYFIGSFAASSTAEYSWFLRGMRIVSKRLGVEDESRLRGIVANFFYVDRLMRQHWEKCFALWNEDLAPQVLVSSYLKS